jgi:hypothetical protein
VSKNETADRLLNKPEIKPMKMAVILFQTNRNISA